MPLKETEQGKVCPLEKFEIDGGAFTKDPVEACFDCNFGDRSQEEFDLDKICKCPETMTWEAYEQLKKGYSQIEDHSIEGFWKYVQENYKEETKNV